MAPQFFRLYSDGNAGDVDGKGNARQDPYYDEDGR